MISFIIHKQIMQIRYWKIKHSVSIIMGTDKQVLSKPVTVMHKDLLWDCS